MNFAAEDDSRAFEGQQEVMAMLDTDKVAYIYQQWDTTWSAEQLTDAAAELTAADADANFIWKRKGRLPKRLGRLPFGHNLTNFSK